MVLVYIILNVVTEQDGGTVFLILKIKASYLY